MTKTNRSKLTPAQRQEAKPLPPFKRPLREAVREGAKTVTRRLHGLEEINLNPDGWNYSGVSMNDNQIFTNIHAITAGHDPSQSILSIRCPYGLAGEIRYLREPLELIDDYPLPNGAFQKIASYGDDGKMVMQGVYPLEWCWQRSSLPQIHMPKIHARTFVRIVSVTAERIQSVTEAEAVAEQTHRLVKRVTVPDGLLSHKEEFEMVWRILNGDDSWNKNFWCWVVRFNLV